VPLQREREWKRTFNQAEIIARHMSNLSGIPCRLILKKSRKTRSQSSLSGNARRANLRGAFEMKSSESIPSSVLIIDDVITTGATIEECARTLRRAGVKRVYAVSVARAVKNF